MKITFPLRRRLLTLVAATLTALSMAAAEEFVVVIDAGHGGKDPGAQSANKKVNEKDIALSVALQTGELIHQRHPEVKVVYTRKTDVYVTLNGRADIANKAKADLFVSIHCNAAESRKAYGAEVFVLGSEENRTEANLNAAKLENSVILLEKDYKKHYQGYDPNSPESSIIFEYLQNEFLKESIEVAQGVQTQLHSTAKRYNRGVHQAGFLVLHATAMPSILVELGFISNAEEEKYLTSSTGKEKLSTSIANGFDKYYDNLKKSTSKSATSEKSAQDLQEVAPAPNATETIDTQSASFIPDSSEAPIFKVQFLSCDKQLPTNSPKLKGLPDVSFYVEKGVYRYTCGQSTNLPEIQKLKKTVCATYKDAFIVAFRGDKRMDTVEAVNEYKASQH